MNPEIPANVVKPPKLLRFLERDADMSVSQKTGSATNPEKEDNRLDMEFINFEAANNPSPMARAIQMPLGSRWNDPWVNAVINAHNNEAKWRKKRNKA
jgi:hypothetical protein